MFRQVCRVRVGLGLEKENYLRSKTELIFFSGCRYSLTVVKQSCFNGESLKSLTTMWQAVREITNFRLCVTVLLTVALVTHTRL